MRTKLSVCSLFCLGLQCLVCITLLCPGSVSAHAQPGSDDPTPPAEAVKLIFIHHSTGENWLSDGYGNLGQALADNHYFVSDTNYGWGPDAIGDRTDIPNWLEWFRSERTPVYLQALFNESQTHASYTRRQADPGGENSVILIKSCFPNSALEGSPNDLPASDGWLSVGHARYVYNELLQTFAAHPDKLFIIITAPPLSDRALADNARAFNTWLLNDWLAENSYTQPNVAVFDFYNLLTGPEAHHRYANGQVEYVRGRKNTLHYPSGDDHPSVEGSRKATQEFVPLLNVFYHRWRASAPAQAPTRPPVPASPTLPPAEPLQVTAPPAPPPSAASELDTFENPNRSGSPGWQTYRDEAGATRITCAATTGRAYRGQYALQIDFNVVPESWATCELPFDSIQNWSQAPGLSFYLYAGQAGLLFDVDIHTGSPENSATYAYSVEAPPPSAGNWVPITLYWPDFHRLAWEEDAGTPLQNLQAVSGLAFGFNTSPGAPNIGTLWVDELSLLSKMVPGAEAPVTLVPAQPTAPATDISQATPAAKTARRRTGPCASALGVPGLMLVLVLATRQLQTKERKS